MLASQRVNERLIRDLGACECSTAALADLLLWYSEPPSPRPVSLNDRGAVLWLAGVVTGEKPSFGPKAGLVDYQSAAAAGTFSQFEDFTDV
jgi:hypothetical protein